MSRAWLLILIFTVAGGQTLPDVVMTNSTVNTVYEKASQTSEIVGQLAPRTSSSVQNIAKVGDEVWIKLGTATVSGWLLVANLDRNSRVAIRDYHNAVIQIKNPGAAVRELDGAVNGTAGKSLIVRSTGSAIPQWLDPLTAIAVMALTGIVLVLGILVIIRRRNA